ncbi:hypothetical protein HYV49_01180 [Candidatus Pacearchaeota archaeon]|nr:hypothetical protein [Candidatus Pacearchaeota archaeon]
MVEIISVYMIILYSALFGVFAKLTDLLSEHDLKWFRGSSILFGILWGASLALLIKQNNFLANFWIAILIHWIFRGKIDNISHGLATSIVLLVFIWDTNFVADWVLLLSAFFVFIIFGLFREFRYIKSNIFIELNFHGFVLIIMLLVFINADYWIVLLSFFVNTIFYQLTKKFGMLHKSDKSEIVPQSL